MTPLSLFDSPALTSLEFEQRARQRGFQSIAGVDEAGRGPLAGPVVAAAVILPEYFSLSGLTDSKKLSERQRQSLYPEIYQQARAVGIGVASTAEIDRLNILQATLLAMSRAIGRLPFSPDHLLIDGISPVPLNLSQQCIKQGDSRSLSIAAASVVAKVIRDRIMLSYDRQLPAYGFASHKGYGTLQHRATIAEHGPSYLHRKTFAGVKEHLRD
ncbi:MAG: ribonuclease HII [Desulfuromonadales bacterium]|nr:ribonuclease HII [Desulfuromonadales bacterium]